MDEDRHPDRATEEGWEERVAVAAFSLPWEAEVARARLEAEGIDAVLGDEHLIRLDWFVSQAVGGVKVLVPRSEAEAAAALLAESREVPEVGLATEEDALGDPRCPSCLSTNLTYERWSRAAFVASLLSLGFPIPWFRPRYRCGRCKRDWSPEEVGATARHPPLPPVAR